MTLVVTDISRYGIIVVGDSAVTERKNNTSSISSNAAKVQYCEKTNTGFAMWGNAGVGLLRMDHWLSAFIDTEIKKSDRVQDIGDKLTKTLNNELIKSNLGWKNLVRGIHLSGYRDGLPVLFHIHTGHPTELAHELRLYKDYPDNKNWSELHYQYLLNHGFVHLRNGYHPIFGPLFDRILEYSGDLRSNFNIRFPQRNIKGRFEFYKLLVKFVAGTLVASGEFPAVNNELSSIAFNENGVVIDERINLGTKPVQSKKYYGQVFCGGVPSNPLHMSNLWM